MSPRPLRKNIFAISRTTCFAVTLSIAGAQASAQRSFSNVICQDDLPSTRRDELISKLRIITGWPDLKFDEHGFLRIESADAVGGSKSARALLTAVIYGPNLVLIQDASKRSDVVFCKVSQARRKKAAAEAPPVYSLLIDFADFDQVIGDSLALSAFNVGWGFLHELDHVANNSSDGDVMGETGICEDNINLMRRECNLPQRVDYFFTLLPLPCNDVFVTKFVRLAFEEDNHLQKKKKRYWLIWDATLVGGLEKSQQIAFLR